MSQPPLVEVRDLMISYAFAGQRTPAVSQLSFSLAKGETLAIVGESGSGKSTLANALLGLLPVNAQIDQGQLWVDGVDVAQADERTRRRLRGRTIALVPQDPMVSLNPTLRIGQQIGEALVLARGRRYPGLNTDIQALLAQVGLDQPALRARQYPHALSGGMRQRVLIAIALAGEPKLIVADEPTSALDVTVQRRILDHLQHLTAERGISLLIITHDLGMACDRADRLLVMKQGKLIEHASPRQILWGAQQPYTRELLTAAPAFVS
ncbi:MAG: ABC transporter ATP-binding protein, partial [Pseudomonas sp.]|nr:ABC transporter ATP-binding protein [Pseudomonas sp.]